MRTLQEKYNGIQEGTFSKDHFLAEARMQQPQLITRFNGYDDAVQILKNKGMIQEAKKEEVQVKEASYKTSSNSKEVRHLKKRDILGSGDEVVSVSAGAKTPAGKVEVTLKTKSGSTKTVTWGKTTKVGVKPKETVNEISNILRGFLKWIRSVVQHEGTEEQVNQYIDSVESNMRKSNGHEKYIGWEESDYITDFNTTLSEAKEGGDKRYYHLIKGSKKHGEDRQEYVNCFSTMKNAEYVQDQKSENDPENYYQIVISKSQDQPALNEAKQPKATKKGLTDYRYKPTNEMDKYPYEQILRGIRVELETLGVHGTPTAEEYAKALAKVSKNLAKDSIFYTNLVAGVNPKVDLHDKMVPVTAKNTVDTFNGMKKAALKEGFKKLIKKVLSESMGDMFGDEERAERANDYGDYGPESEFGDSFDNMDPENYNDSFDPNTSGADPRDRDEEEEFDLHGEEGEDGLDESAMGDVYQIAQEYDRFEDFVQAVEEEFGPVEDIAELEYIFNATRKEDDIQFDDEDDLYEVRKAKSLSELLK